MVTVLVVEGCPSPLVGGNRDEQATSRSQHAGQLGEGDILGIAMLNHVKGADNVEARIRKGQRESRSAHASRAEPARVQVKRDVLASAMEPTDAGAVSAADVQHTSGLADILLENCAQELGSSPVSPVVGLIDRSRAPVV